MTLLDTSPVSAPPASCLPMRSGKRLPAEVFAAIRRRLVIEHCKWDPQVGDQSTLAPFPLLLKKNEWRKLSGWSQKLAAELMAAECELLHNPQWHRLLAVPRRLRPFLRDIQRSGATRSPVRVLRFDFHWTTDGWQISEVNSDVPGGYTESSAFTTLVAECCDDMAAPAGNPVDTLADAITRAVDPEDPVALLAAPGFMEDQQIVAFLARQLKQRGVRTVSTAPEQIEWTDGFAHLRNIDASRRLGAIFRFYQAEWLARLPRRVNLAPYFNAGKTPVANSGSAIITESKRLPLVWDRLKTPMPTWRSLLPETRDPRDAPWRRGDGWLLKSAYCNTGDTVSAPDLLSSKRWNRASRWVRCFPGAWIAQKRFAPIAVNTPLGAMFPCIGVYTIDGCTAGIYARLSHGPVVDFRAIDAPCLIEASAHGGNP